MARTEDFVSGPGQLRFVYFWAGNDMEAAELAGFSRPSSDGTRCKTHPAVRRLVQLKQEAIALANVPKAAAQVTQDDILDQHELKFVVAWRGDVVEAARAIGADVSHGLELLSRPAVARAIHKKQSLLIAASIKAQFEPVPRIGRAPGKESPCSHATR